MESKEIRKRHFIRGIVIKDAILYAPLIQIARFCHRFPEFTSKQIGDQIEQAIEYVLKDKEKLKDVPEVKRKEK